MGNCVLPETGASVAPVVIVAAFVVIAGVIACRTGRRRALPLVLVALMGAAVSLAAAVPAAAAPCAPTTTSVAAIVQPTTPPTTVAVPSSAPTIAPSTTSPPTTSSTTSSTTSTTSTTTTTAPLPAPIARNDDFFPGLDGESSFNVYANDDLFGLSALPESSWTLGTCLGILTSFDVVTGILWVAGPPISDCALTYTVVTAGGTSSATITLHAPAP